MPTIKGTKFSEEHKKKIKIGVKKHLPSTIFQKGNHPKTEFKKGHIPHHKGKKGWTNNGSFKKGHPKIFFKHTEETKKKMRGINKWNWKGGISSERDKIRGSMEFKLWRKSVFQRDNFTCQKTGIRGGNLVAHHINNFSDFPELRFAIDNGITLSKKAHKEFHQLYRKENNTHEQLEEFLKK